MSLVRVCSTEDLHNHTGIRFVWPGRPFPDLAARSPTRPPVRPRGRPGGGWGACKYHQGVYMLGELSCTGPREPKFWNFENFEKHWKLWKKWIFWILIPNFANFANFEIPLQNYENFANFEIRQKILKILKFSSFIVSGGHGVHKILNFGERQAALE